MTDATLSPLPDSPSSTNTANVVSVDNSHHKSSSKHVQDELTPLIAIDEMKQVTAPVPPVDPPNIPYASIYHEMGKQSCEDYIDEIVTDLKNNLFIVSLPGCFTNTIWRLMNLYGIADSTDPLIVIWETAVEIATVVLALCALVDYVRRFTITKRQDRYVTVLLSPSIILGIKFYFGVVGWTIGYEIGTLSDEFTIGIRGIFAGIGNYIGLLIACELINIYQFVISGYDIFDPDAHFSSLGVAFRGFWEGIVWSVIGDAILYSAIGKIADSLLVGISASLAFSISGVFTSIFAVWYQSTLTMPDVPKFGATDTKGSVHFNHSLNAMIEGASIYSVSAA